MKDFDRAKDRPRPASPGKKGGRRSFQSDEAAAHAGKERLVFRRRLTSMQRAAQQRSQKRRDSR